MKTYRINPTIGKCRHSVSYYDGTKTHKDGSPFWDLVIFKTKRAKVSAIRKLNRK